jgi:aspartyl-tRNA(Asn)/glutamyl-tRNA(Gln) amidotransferase subunit A
MTGAELARSVQAGETSAASLVEAALARIEARDGELNAFNLVAGDAARAQAAEIDRRAAEGEALGPLAGLPIAIKDNICTDQIDTTCSSRMLEGWRPAYDATVVERLRAADAILIGKTNMDEFGMGSMTENSAFGPTRNPHDPELSPGGSSGGSAAAVSAGMVSMALGSDTGGSVRQPAALCGVVGLKPTYGLVSRYGLIAYASSLDQIGPLSSTVADAALLLGAIAGHDQLDATSLPGAAPDYGASLDIGAEGLRVGIVSEMVSGCDPEVTAAVREAGDALERAGATVAEVSVPSLDTAIPAYYLIALAEASSNLSRYDGVRYGLRADAETTPAMMAATRAAGFGAEVKRRIMLGTYALTAGYYDEWYGKAQRVRTLIIEQLLGAYADFDLLLAPVVPKVSLRLGEMQDPIDVYLSDRCTVVANLVGHPSLSVPFGASEGRPIGVQLMANALDEPLLFRAATQLEAAARWVAPTAGATEGVG